MAINDNKVYTIRMPQKRTINLKIAKKTYQIQLPKTREFIIRIKDFAIANTALLSLSLGKIHFSINSTLKWFPHISLSLGKNHITINPTLIIKPIQPISLGKNTISITPTNIIHPQIAINHPPISMNFNITKYIYETLTMNCGKYNIDITSIVGREKLLNDYLSSTLNSLKNITLDRMKIS